MKAVVWGANGAMGRLIRERLDGEVAGLVSLDGDEGVAKTGKELGPVCADVVIDFSHHSAAAEVIAYAKTIGAAAVIGTTGHTPEEKQLILDAAKEIPVFFSANMSIGVALLAELAKKAASVFPEANIEIVEKHHNQKLDVPSGTALLLAHRIQEALTDTVLLVGRHENGKRTTREIGIHSLRMGNEVGTHEIIIATGAETITLKHEAENRSLFANGALAAAKFLEGKPAGLYSMQDII